MQKFKKGEFKLNSFLEKIEPSSIYRLIKKMLKTDPNQRFDIDQVIGFIHNYRLLVLRNYSCKWNEISLYLWLNNQL